MNAARPDGGGLTALQSVSAVPPGARDTSRLSTAAVQVTPDARFLPVEVHGSHAIGAFAIGEDGRLSAVGFLFR